MENGYNKTGEAEIKKTAFDAIAIFKKKDIRNRTKDGKGIR